MNETSLVQSQAAAPAAMNHLSLNPQALIAMAIEKGASIDHIERLLAIRQGLIEEEAAREFHSAMSALQQNMPVIDKTKKVFDNKGKLRYCYADIGAIVKQSGPLIAQAGFSFTVDVVQESNCAAAIVTIAHSAGHRQKSEFRAPIDPTAYMSEPQKWASAATFAKRQAFCNAFGILTGDEDDDNDIAHPANNGQVLVDPQRETYLAAIRKLSGPTFGTEEAYLTFLAGRDPNNMPTEELAELGRHIKGLYEAKRAQSSAPEVIEGDSETGVASRPQIKMLFALATEKGLSEAALRWWLAQKTLAPMDEAKGRPSIGKMSRENVSIAIELLQNTPPKSILDGFLAHNVTHNPMTGEVYESDPDIDF